MNYQNLPTAVKTFFYALADMVFPRRCCVCGNRLALEEHLVCTHCFFKMPRTFLEKMPSDNKLTDNIATAVPFRRCVAFTWHVHGSPFSHLVYQLKYYDKPEIGIWMGRLMAEEMKDSGFFDGIDLIVPVPITPERQRWRGYNQSEEIAKGITSVIPLPICTQAVIRNTFNKSQTKNTRQERIENVKDAFTLTDAECIRGKHLLLVDDIITTGATLSSCAQELDKAGDIRLSILAWGATQS